MKIAIVYDWMDKIGGVERLLITLNEMFPEADWYTSYHDADTASWTKEIKGSIHTSFLQRFPDFIKKSRILSLPFYTYIFEAFNFSKYDLVISVSSSFAKGVITKPGTRHISIILTPTRWLWGQEGSYKTSHLLSSIFEWIRRPIIKNLRIWDYAAAQRPDEIISISQAVSDRVHKYYGRSSKVIYPPFDVEYWRKVKSEIVAEKSSTKNIYFLVVSRLEPYKNIKLVIECWKNFPDKKLIIIGKGTQKNKLEQIAGENVFFIEDVSDLELAQYYTEAEGLIMPQEEDFGYVSLEAQYFNCPVIAFRNGGSSETIIEGKTGLFFHKQNIESLREAVEVYRRDTYNLRDPESIIEKFSKEKFIEKCAFFKEGKI